MNRKTARAIALAVVALTALVADRYFGLRGAPLSGEPTVLLRAIEEKRSDQWVEASGRVIKLLGDDTEGSRHQRFLIEVAPGRTVLIAHNIDLAPRVPVSRGDEIAFRGEFEWNDRGGVVHWTHHDPKNRRQGGWIEHRGRRFR